jgi:hypothetical protein
MGKNPNQRGLALMQMRCLQVVVRIAVVIVAACSCPMAQTQNTYQPKFAGDPARSESEASALGYLRTVIRAQKLYEKKNSKYATSLLDLVHTGNFTRRMTNTDRSDYTVGFRSHKDGYEVTLTPKQQDAEHRSFYAKEDGVIHADETKTADENSPKVK